VPAAGIVRPARGPLLSSATPISPRVWPHTGGNVRRPYCSKSPDGVRSMLKPAGEQCEKRRGSLRCAAAVSCCFFRVFRRLSLLYTPCASSKPELRTWLPQWPRPPDPHEADVRRRGNCRGFCRRTSEAPADTGRTASGRRRGRCRCRCRCRSPPFKTAAAAGTERRLLPKRRT
jgi:hypothetical protein